MSNSALLESAARKLNLSKSARKSGRTKAADPMGGSSDGDFSRAFAALALTNLERNPRILENLVGFQLLDRSDDDYRAAGVFAAQIEGMMFYVPMIFSNGRVKGHELLFCKTLGAMVPNKEKWVNTLVNRGMVEYGDPMQHPGKNSPETPNYRQMTQPPPFAKTSGMSPLGWLEHQRLRKAAEDQSLKLAPASWPRAFREVYTDLLEITQAEPLGLKKFAALDRWTLPLLLDRSRGCCQEVFRWSQAWPLVYKAAQQRYGASFLTDALVRWDARLEQQELEQHPKLQILPEKSADVSIIKIQVTSLPDDSTRWIETDTEDAREKALRKGYLVRDGREDDRVSCLVSDDGSPDRRFVNPMFAGVHNMLLPDGKLEPRVVLSPLPHLMARTSLCCVVDPSGKDSNAVILPTDGLWVTERPPGDEEFNSKWASWLESLPKAGDNLETGATYLFVHPTGEALGPYCLVEDAGSGAFRCHLDRYAGSALKLPHNVNDSWTSPFVRAVEPELIVFRVSDRPADSKVMGLLTGRVLYMEGEFRALKIPEEKLRSRGNDRHPPAACALPWSFVKDWLTETHETFKLAHRGKEFHLVEGSGRVPAVKLGMDRFGQIRWLVEVMGFREPEASGIVDQVEKRSEHEVSFRFGPSYPDWNKAAAILQPQGLAGPMPRFEPPTEQASDNPLYTEQMPENKTEEVPLGSAPEEIFDLQALSRPMQSRGPDPQVLQIAQQAGQLGIDNVMDTAFMSSMLQQRNIGSLVQEDMPYFFMTLDRLGRQLLRIYYRPEIYRERYGDADLPVLEDMLLSLFDQFGDLIIMLKEKDVSPLPNLDAAESSTGLSENYRNS